jgi:cation transport regulator
MIRASESLYSRVPALPLRTQIAALERRPVMPYRTNEDLPDSVARHLPPHAQDIYRAAFNHAFAAHAGDPRQEEAAHRIAWAAVKRSYVKIGDSWVARQGHD